MSVVVGFSKDNSPFLNEVRRVIRVKRLSLSTERSYLHYIIDYIYFHNKRHPEALGEAEVQAYLSHLALEKQVAASTQNVALSALLFLYTQVLDRELGTIDAVRAKRPKRLPTVFSRDEVTRILTALEREPHPYGLILSLLYGSRMRLMEELRLRVKDVNFNYGCRYGCRRVRLPRNFVTHITSIATATCTMMMTPSDNTLNQKPRRCGSGPHSQSYRN